VNQANAEARSVKEIARAVARYGENPAKYLLALKYIDALKRIAVEERTSVEFLPSGVSFLKTASEFGVSTVLPRGASLARE
jgi:hypothetical protein